MNYCIPGRSAILYVGWQLRRTWPDIVGEFKGENVRQPEGIAEVGSSLSHDEACESRYCCGDDNHSFYAPVRCCGFSRIKPGKVKAWLSWDYGFLSNNEQVEVSRGHSSRRDGQWRAEFVCCEMTQKTQGLRTWAMQKTKDTYLSGRCRNGGEEMEELELTPSRKSNIAYFGRRNHLNFRTLNRSKD